MDITTISSVFPILSRKVEGKRLVYLDNSATTQKPKQVIDAITDFYGKHNANVHRGIHTLSTEASQQYEDAHAEAASFINAKSMDEIIFTRNTTESINLLANAWGRKFLRTGDVVVLSEMEHHSNIVPWQILRDELGISLEWIAITDDGLLDMDSYRTILKSHKKKVKLVSVTHISNVLGTVNPVQEICMLAHEAGALCAIDSAQAAARQKIDVVETDVDFVSMSSHKMYGPDGVGVLYGKKSLLDDMNPWMSGGGMIQRVTKDTFSCAEVPWKFEAGTPAICGGVVFARALSFISAIGMDQIVKHEKDVMAYALEKIGSLQGVSILGPVDPDIRLGALSFVFDDIHPHDMSSLLNEQGIAVRAGHHCAMPLHIRYSVPASTRISLAVYNTRMDIDCACDAIERSRKMFSSM